ncbi:MAG: radical SAM protein [Candidatus Aenigmatarchaeota archaeon]
MEEKIKRLVRWSKGRKSLPYSIELSPTLRCNLNCLFCWRYGKKIEYGDELTLEEYKRILKEAEELKVREIRIIGGGEPLLRKDTFELMKEVKKHGMFGYICTNGTLFSDEAIKTLVSIGWDHVKISVHAPDKKTQDFLAQGKSFERQIKNIKSFVGWKRKLKSESPKIEIGLVLNRLNFRKVMDMVKLVKKLNVQAFFIEPITVYTKIGKNLKLRNEESEEFKEIARKAYSISNGLETNLQQFFSRELIEKTGKMLEEIKKLVKSVRDDFLSIPCYEPWWRMGIRVDGWVCPCGFLDQNTRENVRNKSLKEIWFGEYFEERRKQLLQKNMPKYCQKCCTTLVQYNQIIREELSKFIG